MSTIYEYCIEKLKKNKKTSFSIAIAIFIAAAFISTLGLVIENFRQSLVKQEIADNGNWHAEILEIKGKDVETLYSDKTIERVMIKGGNQTVQLPNELKQNYLYIQYGDSEYWNNMKEKNLILEGRMPMKENEIVIGKNFFEENPNYKLGSSIIVMQGERKQGEEKIEFLSPKQENETFLGNEKKEVKIVGSIDMTISSGYDGYAAYGWLDVANLKSDTDIVAYLQMKNIKQIYDNIPNLSKELKLTADEYGEYPYRYNTKFLEYKGVFAPGKFWSSDYPVLFIGIFLFLLITICIFSYIIKGAFSIASQKFISEYAILKSVGASPKQIRRGVIFEAIVISIVPIVAAQILSFYVAQYIYERYIYSTGEKYVFDFEISTAIIMLVTSLLTVGIVLIAVFRQTKKFFAFSPIEIIKEEDILERAKISKFKTNGKIFDILVKNNLIKNKKLFKTCSMTLGLGLLVTLCFITMFTVSNISNDEAEADNYYNINVTLQSGNLPDEKLVNEIKSINGIKETSEYTTANCAMWISENQFSKEFITNKGLEKKAADENIVFRDNKYRIPCILIGVDNETYVKLAEKAVSSDNTQKLPEALVVNEVCKNPDASSYQEQKATIPYLKTEINQPIILTEKFRDSMKGDYQFALETVGIIKKMPNLGLNVAFYNLPIIISKDKYVDIISNFNDERKIYNNRLYLNILSNTENELTIKRSIDEICTSVMSTSDFFTSSKQERAITRKEMTESSMMIAYVITALFTVVGVSSAIVSIYSSFCQRRREIAMLRSVGLSGREISSIVRKEAAILSIRTDAVCIVIWGIFTTIVLKLQKISWLIFLREMGIWKIICFFTILFLIIYLLYYSMSKSVRKDNIVEVIKEKTI